MCGICAVSKQTSDLHPGVLWSLTRTMTRRGPDDSGVRVMSSGNREIRSLARGNIGLGHTRLAVIDVSSDGHQPMVCQQTGRTIVFNGEIYNYRELRADLERLGIHFRTDSDTEVLLAAYGAWSHEMLPRLNGMFAFAIWDPQVDELFVARDRLGIKPLVYFCRDGCFACASDIRALRQLPTFPDEICPRALQHYLTFGYVAAPHTMFRGCFKLPPGHYLRVHQGEIRQHECYWDPLAFYATTGSETAEPDALDQLEELLASAVKYRMISDVPLGALLSGGVDSSLVVAMMRQQSTASLQTFTIGFEDIRLNEAGRAAAVARHLHTDHHELVVTDHELRKQVNRIAMVIDEPLADMSLIPMAAVSELTRRHVTVALSGDGGDETHLGYRTYDWMRQRQSLHRLLPGKLARWAGDCLAFVPRHRLRRVGQFIATEGEARAFEFLVAYWSRPDVSCLLSRDVADVAFDHPHDRAMKLADSLPLLARLAAGDLTSYLVDDVLQKVDRASMAVALEMRVPLLDHRLVEFAAHLPVELKRKGGVGKYLLRHLLYRHVPRDIVDRPKQGFNVPMSQWLRGPLQQLARETLSDSRLGQHGLFAPAVVQKMLAEHGRGRNHSKRIWNLLVFQMWFDQQQTSVARAA